jgi:xanthine dehydrogenase accessory factor
MREILDEVLALLDGGEDFALVKLIGDRGSTPRSAGAEMLVRRDGSIAGTIGGGLLELTMMKQAAEVLDARVSRVVDLRLAGDDLASDEEMVCGGSAEVLITYVPPGDAGLREVLAAVKAVRSSRRRAWLFNVLPLEEGGEVLTCLLEEDGTVVGAQPCEPRALRTAVGKIAVHGSTKLPDGRPVVVEQVEVPSTAVVCGGGHVARAIVPAALAADFAVTVLDDREEFADPRRFPGAKVVLGSFDGALERLGVDAACYVVIVTRGHTHDMDVLVQALRTPARYIGLMASRSKHARMVAALRDAGLGEDALGRVHSPIGLDIGAETPAELAVSVVAQMIQVRAGKSA